MVREFRLQNEKGQSFSLMDIKNNCLLTEPSGLGFSYATEYERIGNTFIESFRTIQQEPITATLNFLSYDNFKKFGNFVANSEKLKLCYKIPFENKEEEYFKDVKIESLGKTEKKENGVIEEPVVFNWLSLWYKENTFIYNMIAQEREIRWNFRWNSKFTSYNTRSLAYINEGHVDAPILLEISGHVLNPEIQLFVEGELMQTVTFNVEIQAHEKLLYGTKEDEFYLKKQNTDGTLEDLYMYYDDFVLDFANDNVVRLPKNKSCEIRLTAENDITDAQIKILEFYIAI